MSAKNFHWVSKSNQNFGKVLKNKMQKYEDKRTIIVKQILRDLIYQTHFFDHKIDFRGNPIHVDDGFELPRQEEEIITDLCYLMTEQFIPAGEIIFNKGDDQDHIMIVLEGEIQIKIRQNVHKEMVLDTLVKRCSYGYHTVLKMLEKDDNDE
jgi:hypothetical protein